MAYFSSRPIIVRFCVGPILGSLPLSCCHSTQPEGRKVSFFVPHFRRFFHPLDACVSDTLTCNTPWSESTENKRFTVQLVQRRISTRVVISSNLFKSQSIFHNFSLFFLYFLRELDGMPRFCKKCEFFHFFKTKSEFVFFSKSLPKKKIQILFKKM